MNSVYKKLYESKEYRKWSPGEGLVHQFLEVAKPYKHETLIDFGCGTGRAAKLLSEHLKVTALDFADNAIETDVEFHVQDLTQDIPYKSDYGFCTDVMEHIPTEDVPKVLKNILKSARKVFFQISTVEDGGWDGVDEPLHLTVKPMSWWVEQFENLHCEIKWAKHGRSSVLFYVSAYIDWANVGLHINLTHDKPEENIKTNLEKGYNEIQWHPPQETEVILLGGGSSLNQFVDDIWYQHRVMHMPIVTTNGTYNWALKNGFSPGAQVILDGREFNKRFVDPVIPSCQYLLCSQCHPSVLESVPKDQLLMWHSAQAMDVIKDGRGWFPVLGGSTVMLRAFMVLQILGIRKFHVYGFDSCILEDHHAYPQPENDSEKVIEINVGGKWFKCHYWMATQAKEFMEMMRAMLQDCEMHIYGPGLIAHIINTAGEMNGSSSVESLQLG